MTNRRSVFKKAGLAIAAVFGIGSGISKAGVAKKEVLSESVVKHNDVPLFSGGVNRIAY